MKKVKRDRKLGLEGTTIRKLGSLGGIYGGQPINSVEVCTVLDSCGGTCNSCWASCNGTCATCRAGCGGDPTGAGN